MELRCESCGTVLLSGYPVIVGGVCPQCNRPFFYPPVKLEINLSAADEIAKTMRIIDDNGGFGSLIVKFQAGSARFVGLGETLRDAWKGGK